MAIKNDVFGLHSLSKFIRKWRKFVLSFHKQVAFLGIIVLILINSLNVPATDGHKTLILISATVLEIIMLLSIHFGNKTLEYRDRPLIVFNDLFSNRLMDLANVIEIKKQGLNKKPNVHDVQEDLLDLITKGSSYITGYKYEGRVYSNLMIPKQNEDGVNVLKLVAFSQKSPQKKYVDLNTNSQLTEGAVEAYKSKKRQYVPNVNDHLEQFGRDKEYKSFASFPIISNDTTIAVVNIDFPEEEALGKFGDTELLEELEQLVITWLYAISVTVPLYDCNIAKRVR